MKKKTATHEGLTALNMFCSCDWTTLMKHNWECATSSESQACDTVRNFWCNVKKFTLYCYVHGPNIYKDTKPFMSAFLKNLPVKVLGGRCLSVWGPQSPTPPPLYTLCEYIHTPVLIHTCKGGGGRWTSGNIRGALVHKRGQKYQQDWLYLQSIKSIKHQKRRQFGVWCLYRYLVHG